MKLRLWIALFSILTTVGLWSCLKDQPSRLPDNAQLHFKEVSLLKKSKVCEPECAKVSVKYPKATSGEPDIQARINKVTEQKVLESLAVFSDNQKLVVNLDSAMSAFIKLYEQYVTKAEFFTIPWELKIQGKVEYQSENTVCLRLDNNSYTGGAHPNHHTVLLNFNTNTGDLLNLKDVVRDVNEFKNIAEDILFGKRKKEESDDHPLIELTSESFFMLPENFAIKEDGILLYYNPYEASDYANGSISFLVSFDDLKPILARDFRFSD